MMIFKKLLACACLAMGAISHAAEPPLRILTTIKPLQLIAVAVTDADPAVRVDVLLPPQISPHHYQLKPSDREKLAAADVVFWVGPGLELFLQRVLANTAGADRSIAFQPNGDHELDAHIWMEPMAAAAIAEQMAARLGQLRPQRAAEWRNNAVELRRRLTAIDGELKKLLDEGRMPGYVVSHDALGGFESRYGLRHIATLSDGEERPPGPRRIAFIKAGIERGQIGCALLEPHYDRKVVATLLANTKVRQVTVDTMAGDVPVERQGLEAFYRGLGGAFARCFER